MIKDKNKTGNTYISDSGIIEDSTEGKSVLFVSLCNILSILLIILGIITIINA